MQNWFDADYYAQQKAAQMNATGYDLHWLKTSFNADKWTTEAVKRYIDEWTTPEGNHITALDNFFACNTRDYSSQIRLDEINISCNPLFDVETYASNLAYWANRHGYEKSARSEWTAATITEHVFYDQHMSLWEHYASIGMYDFINPSDDFDTKEYLEARVDKMRQIYHNDNITIDDALKDIAMHNANPIMDYYTFGIPSGIDLDTQPESPATPVAPVFPGAPASGASGKPDNGDPDNQPDNPDDKPDDPDDKPDDDPTDSVLIVPADEIGDGTLSLTVPGATATVILEAAVTNGEIVWGSGDKAEIETKDFGGTINADSAATFAATVDGTLANGSVISAVNNANVTDSSFTLKASEVEAAQDKPWPMPGSITVISNEAGSVNLEFGGSVTLSGDSSFANAENLNIQMAGGTFDMSETALTQLSSLTACGGKLFFGELSGEALSVEAESAEHFNADSLTGAAEVSGNISAGDIYIGRIQSAGAVDLSLAATDEYGWGVEIPGIAGQSISLDTSKSSGEVFLSAVRSESTIEFTGGDGELTIVEATGIGAGNSRFEFGKGSDSLTISTGPDDFIAAGANIEVNLGEGADEVLLGSYTLWPPAGIAVEENGRVNIGIDLGDDSDRDTVELGGVSGGKLFVSLTGFVEGTDQIALLPGTEFARQTEATASQILEDFGIDATVTAIDTWGGEDNVAILADGASYLYMDNCLIQVS